MSRARAYLRLGRVSNLPTVWTNVLAGVFLSGAPVSPATMTLLALALSLFYVAPSARLANQWDTKMGGALADAISCNAVVKAFGAETREEGAGLFRRFALMRSWYEARHLSFTDFVSPDGLHMNDWGYDCIARQLARAIDAAVAKPATTTAAIAVH